MRIRIGASLSARKPAADLDAVELRQPEVEDDEVGHEVLGGLERRHAVGGGAHLVALLAQRAAKNVRDLGVVLDDEDAAGDRLAGEHQHKVRARLQVAEQRII